MLPYVQRMRVHPWDECVTYNWLAAKLSHFLQGSRFSLLLSGSEYRATGAQDQLPTSQDTSVSLNNLGKMRLFWLSQLELSKLASLGILADRQNSQHIKFSCQQTHCLPLSKGYRELQSRLQGGTVEDIIFFVLLLGCLCVGEG